MPSLISNPTRITAAGNKPKLIDEYFGLVNSGESRLSIAHMRSPGGWVEPGQTPEFDEFTLVLKGSLRVAHRKGAFEVVAGQAVLSKAGEWVQYSTPNPQGAEYIAIWLHDFDELSQLTAARSKLRQPAPSRMLNTEWVSQNKAGWRTAPSA